MDLADTLFKNAASFALFSKDILYCTGSPHVTTRLSYMFSRPTSRQSTHFFGFLFIRLLPLPASSNL